MKRLSLTIVLCLAFNVIMAQRNDNSLIFQHGNKVFIPCLENDIAQKAGAMKIRELITKDQLWSIVEQEKDAQFTLEFIYSEEGRDHGIVNMKDKNGILIATTPKVKDGGRELVKKGETIAESLYEKYISDLGTKLKVEDGRLLISGRRKGVVLRPELGVGTNLFSLFSGLTINASGTLAYQFNPYVSAGVSLCLEHGNQFHSNSYYSDHASTFSRNNVLSTCLNFRTYLCEKTWSPFIDIKGGLCWTGDWVEGYEDWTGFYPEQYIRARYRFGGMFGCQYKGFDFGLSYANIYCKERFDSIDYWNGSRSYHILSINVAYNISLRKKL